MYEKNEGKLMFADVENHETTWILSAFQVKDLYAPFVLDKDNEYFDALEKKYNLVIQRARDVGADDQSIEILETFSKKIMESLGDYQNADVEECYGKIRKLIKEIGTCLPAVGDFAFADWKKHENSRRCRGCDNFCFIACAWLSYNEYF